MMNAEGVNVGDVAELMRHTDVRTTLNNYYHPPEEKKKKNIEKCGINIG